MFNKRMFDGDRECQERERRRKFGCLCEQKLGSKSNKFGKLSQELNSLISHIPQELPNSLVSKKLRPSLTLFLCIKTEAIIINDFVLESRRGAMVFKDFVARRTSKFGMRMCTCCS